MVRGLRLSELRQNLASITMKIFLYSAIGLLLLFTVQSSYIHPDEHFQSLEIMARDFAGISVTVPWEFTSEFAARSFVPLYLYYGPLYFVMIRILNIQDPNIILVMVRLQNLTIYLLACHFVCKSFVVTKNLPWVRFLLLTSYTTTSIQSHSFSNSIETIILLLTLGLFQNLSKSTQGTNHFLKNVSLGFLISVGIFNRITFLGFIFLPSLSIFKKYYLKQFKLFIVLIVSIITNCYIFTILDTIYFQNDSWTITAWNNLKYNMDVKNLSTHGLHARYTHLLINLPQLIGPVILIIFNPRIIGIKKKRKTNKFDLLILSIVSGLIILSIFQHQEMRFLMPLVPLFLMKTPRLSSKIWLMIWLVFNFVMTLVMSFFHQSGVLRYLNHYYQETHNNYSELNQNGMGIHIWWKNYMPPTWMYMNPNLVSSTTKIVNNTELLDNISFERIHDHVVDLKGSDFELLQETIDNFFQNMNYKESDQDNDEKDKNAEITLMLPASVLNKITPLYEKYQIVQDYHTYANLDMDHFDIDDMTTFIPGFYAFNIRKKQVEKKLYKRRTY